ncbi:hypothetical protein AX17_007135 [Amanita inopinata Kibby_2008]|nr:hypothetical protein AX17_007135 [Amanita inopinata Kibby_2008]
MLPHQQPQQPQSKRKEGEDNPLLGAAKRSKKEGKNASNKRKLLANVEATRSGLLIVRESPSSSQPEPTNHEPRPPLQPSSSLPLKRNGSSDLRPPPSKKPRAGSQPPMPSSATHISRPTSSHPAPTGQSRMERRYGSLPPEDGKPIARQRPGPRNGYSSIIEEEVDAQIEDDVRAMDAEADHLRRNSRVYVPEPSTPSTPITFQSEKDKSKGKSKTRASMLVTDTTLAIPLDETPQIVRNKRLREGAMNAIAAANSDTTLNETSHRGRDLERESNTVNGHHRRKSSISGRGKRISISLDTGVIPQPHNSVSETSFYKHIDADLPDSERLRQLLIWCASRAATKYTSAPSKPNSSSSANAKDNPGKGGNPPPNLPPLSSRATQVLKGVQESVIRMLAERRIDLSMYGDNQGETSRKGQEKMQPNEQNVTNRMWEVRYAEEIKRAREEDEAWKRVSYYYDAYIKRQKEALDKRTAATVPNEPPESNQAAADAPGDGAQPATPSAKGKGKQRDPGGDDPWNLVRDHELPEDMQHGARVARTLMASLQKKPPSQSQTSPASQKRPRRSSFTPLPRHTQPDGGLDIIGESLEGELQSRLDDVGFKLDFLFALASAARSTANVAEAMLNRRFALLNQSLMSRTNLSLSTLGAASSSTSAPSASSTTTDPSRVGGILKKYAPRQLSYPPVLLNPNDANPDSSEGAGPSQAAAAPGGIDPQDLLRALSRVDRLRPPALVGDAARRAVREVQRVGESGVGVVGEKRITGVVGNNNVLQTPRKTPTTPRRGGERTPRRERTPVRDR